MQKSIDIVAFNVPYPPDYGGVIDVFYRVKALSQLGYSVTLHCFRYGRDEAPQLEEWCEHVVYYPRRMKFFLQFSIVPFIVISRSSKALLNNLIESKGPIFFEGLHSTWFLNHPRLKGRFKGVRAHNVEHHYYSRLAKAEPDWLKKIYFRIESFRLKRYEKQLAYADAILAISESDALHFSTYQPKTFFIPPFHRDDQVNIIPGFGEYLLYHGNLAVQENHEAALFILNEIAPKTNYPIIIAGHAPRRSLSEKAKKFKHVELVVDPSDERLDELVARAHIHLLPTFQATGFKLKLLYALFRGRFCVATPMMVAGTGLENLCSVKSQASELLSEVDRLMKIEFSPALVEARRKVLENAYSNRSSGLKIDRIIFPNETA